MEAEAQQPTAAANSSWDTELADLLSELTSAQSELLALLDEKRSLLMRSDTEALAKIQPREQELIERLTACHQRRCGLLERAAADGLPADSIRSLSAAVAADQPALGRQIQEAQGRSRLLQHHSLTNWVLVQRTMIHLSQLLEIIATGGRPQPTYGKGAATNSGSGSLVDQAV